MSTNFNPRNVPEYLRLERRWVCWKYITRDGQKTKTPVRPDGSGRLAKSNDAATWGGYEDAVRHASAYRGKDDLQVFGIGFMLGGGYCGLDLDHVLDVESKEFVNDKAKEIIEDLHGAGHAEVSPSGDGVKVIFQCDKPEGYRSRQSLGGSAELEFYGEGRFFTVTGDTEKFSNFCITRVPDAKVESLCDRFLKAGRMPEKPRPRPTFTRHEIEQTQVEKYVDAVIMDTRQSEGGRNSKMFSISGNIAKKVGFSFDQTIGYCREINQKCFSPPLSDSELYKVVSNSITKGNPRQDSVQIDYGVDLRVVMDEVKKNEVIDEINKEFERYIPYEKFRDSDSFIGMYMRYCQVAQNRDTIEMDFAGALASLSSLLTGKITIEGEGTCPNLFVVTLADSGTGKNFNRNLNKEILRGAGLKDRVGTDGISSGQGFASTLVDSPKGFYALDECHNIFVQSKGMEALNRSISKTINEVWSANGGTYKPNARSDKSLNVEIQGCAPTLYCTGVGSKWWNGFPEDSLDDGLMGRLLIFDCPTRKARKLKKRTRFYYSGNQVPSDILEEVKKWGFNPLDDLPGVDNEQSDNLIEFVPTEDAFEIFDRFYNEVEDRSVSSPTATTPLWTRCYDRIVKVALLLSANFSGANGKREITAGHMDMAIRIVKASIYGIEDRLKNVVSDDVSKLGDKISKWLTRHNKPATLGVIMNNTGRKNALLYKQAIEWAVEIGEVVEFGVSERGKKVYACAAYAAQIELIEENKEK
jgi:hypothetical protein